MLFENYVIENNQIVEKETGRVIGNTSLNSLNLSTRSENALRRGLTLFGKDNLNVTVVDLLPLSIDDLKKIKNLGQNSLDEILEKVEQYLENPNLFHEIKEQSITMPTNDYCPVDDPDSTESLFEDYIIASKNICTKDYKYIIKNIPITSFEFSIRVVHIFEKNNVVYLSNLIGISQENLMKFRSMGITSFNEICNKVREYLDNPANRVPSSPEEILGSDDAQITYVLELLNNDVFKGYTFEEIKDSLDFTDDITLMDTLEKLSNDSKIDKIDGKYYLHMLSFFDVLEDRLNDAHVKSSDISSISVVQLRKANKTLEEIGDSKGITRERVRQLESKAFTKFAKDRLYFEDRFAELFLKYDLEKDFYIDYLSVPFEEYYYLLTKYDKGSLSVEELLYDENFSVEVRRQAEKWMYRGAIKINGEYIQLTRPAIEDYVIENYCQSDTTMDEFALYYRDFISKHNITDERVQYDENMIRSRENRISGSNKVLWKQGRKFRYYDIDARAYTLLYEALRLDQYKDIEISTLKLFNQYPTLMLIYDIKDEYELHNLLKKNGSQECYPNMKFERTPCLLFGDFDRDEAVLETLRRLAPATMDDIANELYSLYGVLPMTAKANWLECISKYYHKGVYSIDFVDLPEAHKELLLSNLSEDFYLIDDIQDVYKSLVPNADVSLISSYNLKVLGFNVFSNYAYRNHSSVEDYVESLFEEDGFVDFSDKQKYFAYSTMFYSVIYHFKSEYKIVEYAPYKYMSFQKLTEYGITKQDIKKLCDDALSIANGEYFTVKSLKNNGLVTKIDSIGFDNYIIAALLKEDSRISWQRISGEIVLREVQDKFSTQEFLTDVIENLAPISCEDVLKHLVDVFGVDDIERYEVANAAKRTKYKYDIITNMIM